MIILYLIYINKHRGMTKNNSKIYDNNIVLLCYYIIVLKEKSYDNWYI